ncbi:hypothetical protein ALI44B_13070 [Leifsonia sp. ALI-44-B]|nr:hypothetical protein ALI44B_13070 [Leifsonia sp. ALI-44-B]
MTTPRAATRLPTRGLASVVPWMSLMAVSSAGVPGAGVSVGVGVGVPVGATVGVGVGAGSVGVGAAVSPAAFVGVMVAERVKSAALSSLSAKPVRPSDLTSVLLAGAVATAFSNVCEAP